MQIIQEKMMNILGPISNWMSNNKFIKAITGGMMASMIVSLGTALIAIVSNLPIESWNNFLKESGLYNIAQDFVTVTLSLLAIYLVATISYTYTKNENENPIIGVVLAMASYLILIPLTSTQISEWEVVQSIDITYLGSQGIIISMIVGLVIPAVYCFLIRKNIKLKLPDSVPPMVTDSLSPVFAGIIILTCLFFVKYGISLTSYGDVFNLVNSIIRAPLVAFGASSISIILFFTLTNLFWFFGVHPSALISTYIGVVLTSAMVENTAQFMVTGVVPYPQLIVVYTAACLGGTGNTLGLAIASLFAKSEKYKSLSKLAIVPNLFNINEPIMFGFPVILNPIYFIPLVFSSIICGGVGLILMNILPMSLIPSVSLPWVTPHFITAFLQGGWSYFLITIVVILTQFIIYLPFFKIDDAKALKEEQENAKLNGGNA